MELKRKSVLKYLFVSLTRGTVYFRITDIFWNFKLVSVITFQNYGCNSKFYAGIRNHIHNYGWTFNFSFFIRNHFIENIILFPEHLYPGI